MKLCELRKEPYTMAELYKIVEEKLKRVEIGRMI